MNNNNNNNNLLPNYIFKQILEYYISIPVYSSNKIIHCNLLTQQIVSTVTAINKTFRYQIIPKIEFPICGISLVGHFDLIYYYTVILNIEFKKIKIYDFQDWDDYDGIKKIKSKLLDFNTDYYIVNKDQENNKEIINLYSRLNDKENRIKFLSIFKSRVKEMNFIDYPFTGQEFLLFKNVKNVRIFIDEEFPMIAFLTSIKKVLNEDISEAEEGEEEPSCKKIKSMSIYSDEDLDFSNTILSQFLLNKCRNLKSLVLSSHIGNDILNIENLFKLPSSNTTSSNSANSTNLKTLSITNCKLSNEQVKLFFQFNKVIENVIFDNSIWENNFNEFIELLSTDKQIKSVQLYSKSPSNISINSLVELLGNNKTLTSLSFNSMIATDDDSTINDNINKFNNTTLEVLEINDIKGNILFEYGNLKQLKQLKISRISEHCCNSLLEFNQNTLESLTLNIKAIKTTIPIQTTIDYLSDKLLSKFINLKILKIRLLKSYNSFTSQNNSIDLYNHQSNNNNTNDKVINHIDQSINVDWDNLFKSINNNPNQLKELYIQSGFYIDERIISNFIESNNKSIEKFGYIGNKVKDWSLLLDPICKNTTLKSIVIDNTPGDSVSVNLDPIRLIIDILLKNQTLNYFNINFCVNQRSLTDSNTIDLSNAIIQNNSITSLSLPHRIKRNQLIQTTIVKKLLNFENYF